MSSEKDAMPQARDNSDPEEKSRLDTSGLTVPASQKHKTKAHYAVPTRQPRDASSREYRMTRIRRLAARLAPIWVAAVVLGSFLPAHSKRALGTEPYDGHSQVGTRHRLSHFTVFGLTTVLFLLASSKRRNEAPLAGAAFLLGCTIELTQAATGFSPVIEWWDIRDDLLGILSAALTFNLTKRLFARTEPAR